MLNIKNVKLNLGDFNLNNISLDVKPNEYFILLGPSGSGKTVLLETIAGLYKPSSGEILFNNIELSTLFPEQRSIGFVYQQYELFPHMTVEQNIVFGLKVRGIDKNIMKEKLHNLAQLFNIEHLLKRHPQNLSGGEKQRVALARALIIAPDILLLDEPLSALDPLNRELLKNEFKKIHANFNTTIIHVTHDLDEAIYLADRIGIMYNGELLQVGSKDEIILNPSCDYISRFLNIRQRRCANGVL